MGIPAKENTTDADNNNDMKSRLVIEICNICAISCTHHPNTVPYIDWYQILQVEEDASIHTIKKQYHKLALLLHPDKNSHPNAQTAFRLVSEAYACIRDETKRNNFPLQRWKSICTKCNSRTSPSVIRKNHHGNVNEPDRQGLNIAVPDPQVQAKGANIMQQQKQYHLQKDFMEQMAEEVRVIQSCLKINRRSSNDYPIFNPSDYIHHAYPHLKGSGGEHCYIKSIHQEIGCVWRRNLPLCYSNSPRRRRFETPAFELRTESCNSNNQSASVSS